MYRISTFKEISLAIPVNFYFHVIFLNAVELCFFVVVFVLFWFLAKIDYQNNFI